VHDIQEIPNMSVHKVLVGVAAMASAPWAMAGIAVPLGSAVPLSAIEGGLLTLAAVGLVAGIRVAQAKRRKSQGR
jgi:hypothetical protein